LNVGQELKALIPLTLVLGFCVGCASTPATKMGTATRPIFHRDEELIDFFAQVTESKFLLHLRADHTCLAWVANDTVFPVRPPTRGRWSAREDELTIQWPESRETFKVSDEAGVLYIRYIRDQLVIYKKTPNQQPPEPTAPNSRGSS